MAVLRQRSLNFIHIVSQEWESSLVGPQVHLGG